VSEPVIDVSRLSLEQRLDLIEELWSSLSDEDRDAIPLTDEQLAELDRRLDSWEAESVAGISSEELHARLARRSDQ
jgi:putative addiction module component (TIGR02574 family)